MIAPITVSYTHLDVYKRQGLRGADLYGSYPGEAVFIIQLSGN